MVRKIGDNYLSHVAKSLDLVKQAREAKTQVRQDGQQVIFHKFIKEVHPSYRFYRFHAEVAKQLQRVIDGDCKRLIISTPPRLGKLCAHDTPVLTPFGWRTHGDLEPGDYVFNPSGKIVQVLATSEEAVADYCVTTSSGEQIWCHANHEWAIETESGSQRFIRSTEQLAARKVEAWLPQVCMGEACERQLILRAQHQPGKGRLGRCIQVDSDDGLYLVGESYVPTHNSLLSSRLLPAAYLLAHPDRYVAICSYSAELAEGFSREAREYYREGGGLIDASNQSVNRWGTEGGGGCWATGIGGSVTGRSASLIIADDTVKGREEADSQRTMEKLWSFYQGSLYTRLEPGHGAIVVVATRWGEGDLTGRLLEAEMNAPEEARENWTIIDWPAISEDQGSRPPLPAHCEILPDWREEAGVALCPQRYDVKDLERIRQTIGPREWSALYQQRPAPIGGHMFSPDWWQYYENGSELPEMDRVMLSVDCTFTNNKDSDFTVGTVIGQCGNRFYVIDMSRRRCDFPETITMIMSMQNKHQINGTIIELAASGHAAYQILQTRIPGLIGYKPGDRSKVARLSGIVPIVEAGNVYLPSYAPWLDTFLNEFNLFPAAKNDDICDSVAQCINYMNQRAIPQMTQVYWGRGAYLPEAVSKIERW